MCKKREKKKMCEWKNETMHRLRSWIVKWKGQHREQTKGRERIMKKSYRMKCEPFNWRLSCTSRAGAVERSEREIHDIDISVLWKRRVACKDKGENEKYASDHNRKQRPRVNMGECKTWESAKGGEHFKAGNIRIRHESFIDSWTKREPISLDPKCPQNIEM